MTAAKVMDIISRLPGCSGQVSDAVSAFTKVNMEDAPKFLNMSKVRMPRYLYTSTQSQMAKIMVQYGRSSRCSRKNLHMVILWQDQCGKCNFKKFEMAMRGREIERDIFLSR